MLVLFSPLMYESSIVLQFEQHLVLLAVLMVFSYSSFFNRGMILSTFVYLLAGFISSMVMYLPICFIKLFAVTSINFFYSFF